MQKSTECYKERKPGHSVSYRVQNAFVHAFWGAVKQSDDIPKTILYQLLEANEVCFEVNMGDLYTNLRYEC